MSANEGMAVSLGSMMGNVNALSCPVISRSSKFAGILTVLGLRGDFNAELSGSTAKQLRLCAKSFGERLP